MTIRRLVAGVVALALLLAAAMPTAHAQTPATVALSTIDELAHQWEGGEVSAEDALELIEEIIHGVPASQRTGVLLDIDDVVHHWEDGNLTAEAAMEQLAGMLHGDGHDHDEAEAVPSPATTGGAGLTESGTSAPLSLGLLVLTAFIVGSARLLGSAVPR
ncbi:MAG: hypothetical protein O2924_02110 [Chloroflexi bacterium]|nr:hypothetical protein [Chloroflexota bacterium]MQC17159.1 hypothetical protein [Chloroflexota bacterium]